MTRLPALLELIAVNGTVLLIAGFALNRLLRRASASSRHLVLTRVDADPALPPSVTASLSGCGSSIWRESPSFSPVPRMACCEFSA